MFVRVDELSLLDWLRGSSSKRNADAWDSIIGMACVYDCLWWRIEDEEASLYNLALQGLGRNG